MPNLQSSRGAKAMRAEVPVGCQKSAAWAASADAVKRVSKADHHRACKTHKHKLCRCSVLMFQLTVHAVLESLQRVVFPIWSP